VNARSLPRSIHGAAIVAVLVTGIALAPTAAAHGPTFTGNGYISNVSSVEPNVLGMFAIVVGGDARLRLSNYSGKTIVIRGYQGEPYLRFDKTGVFQNMRSPATYRNRLRFPASAALPAIVDPSAAPRWKRVARGATYAWSDHRIHWTGQSAPPDVQKDPQKTQLVFRWRVPGSADGAPFAIKGILGYRPAPPTPGGHDWVLPVAVAAVSVLALLGLLATHRRARRAA
jgi:hypothetical protein